MIRVLYITRARLSFSRGHTRNIVKTAEALNAIANISVHVVSSNTDILSFQEITTKHGVTKNFAYDSAQPLFVYILKHRSSFDVLYFRDPKLFYVAFVARFLLRKKVVFEIHGNKEWKSLVLLWLASFWIAHGALFITDRLRKWYNPRCKPWILVHVSAPDNIYSKGPLPSREELRDALRLPRDACILLYLGSAFWYRLDVFIAMMPYVPERCVLVLAGLKDDEIPALASCAKEKKVQTRVRFVGRVEPKNVPNYLFAADVLLNSYTDHIFDGGVSSKLYEYLAIGVPIISYSAGANDEVLQHEHNALLVDSSAPRDYASAVTRVMEDATLARQLGAQAKRDSLQYTWEKRAERIVLLLQKVML
jgi:glycosyltransferase involved in cell wall biosynthesis